MNILKKLKHSFSDSLLNFTRKSPPSEGAITAPLSRDSKTISHTGFRNVFGLYTEEFSGLTAYNIKHYFESSRKGLNFFKAALFEEIKRKDMQIGGVCQSRKLGITGRYKLSRPEEFVKGDDPALVDFINLNLSRINLPVFFSDIVDASITGVSNFEITYEPDGSKLCLQNIQKIPNEFLVYDEEYDRYVYISEEDRDIFKLRSLVNSFDDKLDIGKLNVIELPDEKVLEVHALDGNAGNGLMNGCIDSLIWAFFFKSYLIKDLATFLELFAIPAIIGRYDPLMSKEDRVKFDRAIRDFGNHFRMVVSKDAEIDFITDTNKGSSNEIYHRTLEYWDKKIAIRVLGQNLTTEVSSGSYAAARAHSIIREDFIISDLILCETAMNALIRKLIDLNFPGINEYPVFEFPETKNLEEKQKLAGIYDTIGNMGLKPDKDEVSKELGIKLSEIKNFTHFSKSEEGKNFLNDLIDEVI